MQRLHSLRSTYLSNPARVIAARLGPRRAKLSGGRPSLAGWVNYFRVGNASEVRDYVEMNVRSLLTRAETV